MSDDIRAAAERVRRYEAGDVSAYPPKVGPPPWCPYDYASDVRILTLAYLHEHPADDGEPVTEEWLLAGG